MGTFPYNMHWRFQICIVCISFLAWKCRQNHCPIMKNVHFRLTYVAAKRLCLSSLLSRKWTSQSWGSPLPSPFKMANDKQRFFAAFVLFTEEVTEPQLPAPLPLQALFVNRLVFVAGEAEDGRVSPTLWYSTPPPDDIDPEVDLVRHRPPLAT